MKRILIMALVLTVVFTLPAAAEVEEITVGGSIVVRGQLQTPGIATSTATGLNGGTTGLTSGVLGPVYWLGAPSSAPTTPAELIAGFTNVVGPLWVSKALLADPTISLTGLRSFDDDIHDLDWYTMRTRVNVDAKLSGGVRGFVELQAYDFWGSDVDDSLLAEEGTETGNDDVQLYQAFIEMGDLMDYPFMLRLGRQELAYGREWLIGNNDAGINFSGLSFDAIKVSYSYEDMLQIDAWTAKLTENASSSVIGAGPLAQGIDEDVDFYGLYGSYTGIENMVIDAYWMYVRNADSAQKVGSDTDALHTVGARWAGTWDVMGFLPGMMDYNLEGAYQFGDNASASDGEYNAFALNAMGGYTFTDIAWTPRLEVEYAYFSGDDDAADGDTDAFNRLFSDVHYGELNLGGDLDAGATNLHVLRVGGSAVPAEKLTVSADFYYFMLAEDDEDGLGLTFGQPQYELGTLGGLAAPLAIPVLTVGSTDDSVGMELDVAADYQYTEDLNLRVGWAHFFPDNAIENSWGAGNDDDVDYLYVQAALTF